MQTDVCSAFSTLELAWDWSQQEPSDPGQQNLRVVLCAVRGTNFAATLQSHQLKILVQISACLHLQTHP